MRPAQRDVRFIVQIPGFTEGCRQSLMGECAASARIGARGEDSLRFRAPALRAEADQFQLWLLQAASQVSGGVADPRQVVVGAITEEKQGQVIIFGMHPAGGQVPGPQAIGDGSKAVAWTIRQAQSKKVMHVVSFHQ